MKRTNSRLSGAAGFVLSLVVTMTAMPANAEDTPDPSATQLPQVNVEGKRTNPFEDSDRRLKELLEKSAPCIGCDAKKPEGPDSIVDQVVNTATGLITPQASKPLNHDEDVQREIDRATYEQRHPKGSNP